VRRFALYAGIALLVAAIGAFVFVRRYATDRAESDAVAHTEYIAEAVLPTALRRSDFAAPAGPRRTRQLDRIAKRQLLTDGIARVKLYAPDGRVVYSTDHRQIGMPADDPAEIRGVLGGEPVSDVTRLDAEGGGGPHSQMLETYVPVGVGPGGGRPAGVLELYADYGPIAGDARNIFLPLSAGIAVLLLCLYLSFFPILKRVTRTMRAQMEEIEHKAYHDDLTGLPNRTLFHREVGAAVAEGIARGKRLAVIMIDLDGFKDVNDTLGHDSGDRLLQAVATDLTAHMRHGDTVARLGGDEFGIVAPELADPSAVLALAQKVREILTHRRSVDGIDLAVDAGIGIALCPDHGADVETLLRRADVALYRSKVTHAPALYESEHDHHSPARLSLTADLRQAIANRSLHLEYQPQCVPQTGEMRAVEALVRWQHPRRGRVMPDEFVFLAERSGLIRDLTDCVLDMAVEQCARWSEAVRALPVAVNITAQDLLDSRFPVQVQGSLERWGVDPRLLELEITEKSAFTDLPRARAIISWLSELGVSLAVDDYGTGNSSLANFRHLPVDGLKIDRSFVARMLTDQSDAAIVHSTIMLAHDLGLTVVAEGVETIDVARRLGELGCDLVQGYYFGKPSPPEAIGIRLTRGNAARDGSESSLEPNAGSRRPPSDSAPAVSSGP
jgi:diguanylate cyclase (GGDEF)-like protein